MGRAWNSCSAAFFYENITYGNGFAVEYVYNDIELLREVWYTVSGNRYKAYEYEYTADGQVYKFTDHVNGKSNIYEYDVNGRLIQVIGDVYGEYTY